MNVLRRYKLLLVEDEKFEVGLVELATQDWDIELRVASNGKEALEILESGYIPDGIILDLNMPIMSGIEFLQELRKGTILESQQIRILVLSSSDQENEANATYALSAAIFCKKPPGIERFLELFDAIRVVLKNAVIPRK